MITPQPRRPSNPEACPAHRILALIAAKSGNRAGALAMLRPADQSRRAGYLGYCGMRCVGRELGQKVWEL